MKVDYKLMTLTILVVVFIYFLMKRNQSNFGPAAYKLTDLTLPLSEPIRIKYEFYKSTINAFVSSVAAVTLATPLPTDSVGVKTMEIKAKNAGDKLIFVMSLFVSAHNTLITNMNPPGSTPLSLKKSKIDLLNALAYIDYYVYQLNTYGTTAGYPPLIADKIRYIKYSYDTLKYHCRQFVYPL